MTAYEAMNLYLQSTEFVALSAFEPGLGGVQLGEFVFGMQRLFVVSGAQNVIISLFKVSDEITTELMLVFYKNWNKYMSKHDAFVLAKKSIMTRYDMPKYWGSFILITTE